MNHEQAVKAALKNLVRNPATMTRAIEQAASVQNWDEVARLQAIAERRNW